MHIWFKEVEMRVIMTNPVKSTNNVNVHVDNGTVLARRWYAARKQSTWLSERRVIWSTAWQWGKRTSQPHGLIPGSWNRPRKFETLVLKGRFQKVENPNVRFAKTETLQYWIPTAQSVCAKLDMTTRQRTQFWVILMWLSPLCPVVFEEISVTKFYTHFFFKKLFNVMQN
jgi:hypothetical protein